MAAVVLAVCGTAVLLQGGEGREAEASAPAGISSRRMRRIGM